MAPAHVFAKCELKKMAELPIDMHGRRPTIPAQFNGRDTRLVLDSGAAFSMISAASAAQYNLKLQSAPMGLYMVGVGGAADISLTTVKNFGLIGLTLHNIDFLVGGSEVGGGDGILGQNFLQNFDDEYDLARGVIRLFKTEGCGKSVLAYWVAPEQAYSVLKIEAINPRNPHTMGDASVNGKSIRVMFDTGAYASILSLKAAERAGVKPDSPGVIDAGSSTGIGRGNMKTYLAHFDSFKIGDSEEIKNMRLRIGDLSWLDADMLLGADFFVSHRIFVSNKERRAFLTFNGGKAVFNLSQSPTTAAAEGAPAGQAPEPATSEPSGGQVPWSDAPSDAAGFARRGEGFAARQDFSHALADLSKACELAPNEPEYFYRRALIRLQTGDPDAALSDLDQVLKLREDFLPAYLPRAEIYLRQNNVAATQTDLASVDRLAPKQADLRLALGHLYARMENVPEAIVQLSFWIESHPEDARLVGALSSRCLLRVLQNHEVNLALDDCSKALRRADRHDPHTGAVYANRGMVRLRQGDYDKAMADFNDALKLEPKLALALYGRGVAESHKNQPAAADADITAASELLPKLPERYQRAGIAP